MLDADYDIRNVDHFFNHHSDRLCTAVSHTAAVHTCATQHEHISLHTSRHSRRESTTVKSELAYLWSSWHIIKHHPVLFRDYRNAVSSSLKVIQHGYTQPILPVQLMLGVSACEQCASYASAIQPSVYQSTTIVVAV